MKPITIEDSIVVGSGQQLSARKIGNINGLICDQYGQAVHDGKLTNVMRIPNSKYNLLSLIQLLKDGWVMRGDKEIIEFTKG